MHFTARSLAATRRVFGRDPWSRGGRPSRPRKLSARTANPETLTLSTTQTSARTFALWSPLPLIVGGLICGAGIGVLWKSSSRSANEAQSKTPPHTSWPDAFTHGTNLVKVGSPRDVLGSSPLTKNLIQQDNLFDKMMEVEMVKEIHCYYEPDKKEFYSVVHLGKEVCGYPNTVHGGLTAAIMDEAFGGLMFNIWRSGDLGFSLPAVTARLEIDYCNRLPHDSIVLCTTKMETLKKEGRSFWMQAELCDQAQNVTYATARACFVSPSLGGSAIKWIKGVLGN